MDKKKGKRRAIPSLQELIQSKESIAGKSVKAGDKILPGDTLGQYKIIEELGRGGMGRVYLAVDGGGRRLIALKTLLHKSERTIRRFHREAKSIAQLVHPNIARIYAFSIDKNIPYLVVQYIKGLTLAEYLCKQQPSLAQRLEIILAIAQALAYSHSQGILHRDVKPSNIMVDSEGTPYLMDFGLAKITSVPDKSITKTGELLGTPKYMSPEQTRGEPQKLKPCSDIYSLGAVLYEILTGAPLVKDGNLLNIIYQILNEPIEPPRSINPEIPKEIEAVCLKALAKVPRDRYQSGGEMATDIEAFLSGKPVKISSPKILKRTIFFVFALCILAVTLAWRMTYSQKTIPADAPQSWPLNDNLRIEEAYLQRGNHYYRQKQYDKAEPDYNKAIALKPDYTEGYYRRGLVYQYGLKRYEEAERDYSKAIELDPKHVWAYYYRGYLRQTSMRSIENIEKAESDYNKAIAINANRAEFYYYRGLLYHDGLNRYEKAERDYSKAIELDPEHAWAYYYRGYLRQALIRDAKDIEKVLSDYAKAIELNPKNAWAYYNRGNLCQRFIRSEEGVKNALSDYSKFIELDSTNAAVYYQRGYLRQTQMAGKKNKAEDIEKIISDYSKVIELDPKHREACFSRGELYNLTERYEKAEGDYSRAIALDPGNGYYYRARGKFYLYRKRYREAIDDYSIAIDALWQQLKTEQDSIKAIEIRKSLQEVLWSRARAYTQLQEGDKAKRDIAAAANLLLGK